jgi:hypothetical protein
MSDKLLPPRYERRGEAIVGTILLLLGLFFLALNLGTWFLSQFGIHVELWRLWPVIFVLVAFAFYVPIVVGWRNREGLRWLAVPGTIFLVNGLIFLYNSLTDDWGAWAYLWTLEPLGVGLGLYLGSFLGVRERGAEAAGAILTAISLTGFVLFGTFFGTGIIRVIAPLGLIALGLLILGAGLFRRL